MRLRDDVPETTMFPRRRTDVLTLSTGRKKNERTTKMIARTKSSAAGKSKSNKLAQLYEKLEQKYGPIDSSEIGDNLDLALFGFMVTHLPLEDATKAYHTFKNQFVDWNEVRISSVKEVQEILRGADEPLELTVTLKEFLQNLFTEEHHVGLEFLTERTISEIRSFFKRKPRLADSIVNMLLERIKDYPVMPLDPAMHECLQKLGVISGSATSLQVMKDLYPQIEREKILPLYAYLMDHARSGCPPFKRATAASKKKAKK